MLHYMACPLVLCSNYFIHINFPSDIHYSSLLAILFIQHFLNILLYHYISNTCFSTSLFHPSIVSAHLELNSIHMFSIDFFCSKLMFLDVSKVFLLFIIDLFIKAILALPYALLFHSYFSHYS
jgi:hypothetical protein